ncbi:MAG: hypothetical protein ABJN26_08115 [Stappiaceae bacterium]
MFRVIGVLFVCLFWPINIAWADNCPAPMGLAGLQSIVDAGNGDPVPVIAALKTQGTAGAAVAAYMDYIYKLDNLTNENAEKKLQSVAELYLSSASIQEENVLNRYVLALASFKPDGVEQEQDFQQYVRNFLELNQEYCLFDNDNHILSSIFYRYHRLQKDTALSRLNEARYLRKVIAGQWEQTSTDRYIQKLTEFDDALLAHEVAQWNVFFGREICAPGDRQSTCATRLAQLLGAQEENTVLSYNDSDSLFCNAKLLHEGQVAVVWVCGPDEDF